MLCSWKRYPVLLLCSRAVPLVVATTIATFSDAKCKDSLRSLEGPNGYPNGTCTQLMEGGIFGSFQVVQEDPGCDVTLYGSDSEQFDTCSSTLTVLAEIARCYNSSWVYYSIDECLPPHSTTYPSSTPTFPSTSTPTSTDEPDHYDDNDSQDDKPVLSTAAIVGIAVGGFVALVTLNALAWFLVARRRRKRLGFGAGPGDSYSHSYGPVSRIPPEGMPPKYGGAPGYLDPSVGEVSEMQSPVPEMVGSPPHQPQELPGSSAAAVGIARGGPEVDLGDAHVHDDAEIEYEEEVEDHEEEVSTWESQQHEHQRQLYDQHWRPSPLDGGSQGHSIEMRPVYR